MLTPSQVIPFLNHDDPWVREHALRYFDHCHDPSPLTADDLWEVIDQRGENLRTRGIASALDEAVVTERSFERLLRALGEPHDKTFELHYQHAARNVDFALLAARRDELLNHPRLLDHVREHLAGRLEYAEMPTEQLWDRLVSHGRSLVGAYAGAYNASESDALIEALGRRGYEVGPRALEIMQDPAAAEDWREIFAVRVLGEARYAPAVPALVEKFDIDADVLREQVQNALGRIGTPEVIERLVAFYPGRRWDVRLYADEPIIRIKQPQSEAALLHLLETEEELDLRTGLLIGLTELGSLRGLEASRALLAEEGDDVEVKFLSEALLAVATMSGMDLPEAPAWRATAEASLRRREASAPEAEAMLASLRDNWMKTGIHEPDAGSADDERDDDESWEDDDEFLNSPVSLAATAPDAPVAPIRRTTPKVGRNDPCPCGSGKKYKKCCIGN